MTAQSEKLNNLHAKTTSLIVISHEHVLPPVFCQCLPTVQQIWMSTSSSHLAKGWDLCHWHWLNWHLQYSAYYTPTGTVQKNSHQLHEKGCTVW